MDKKQKIILIKELEKELKKQNKKILKMESILGNLNGSILLDLAYSCQDMAIDYAAIAMGKDVPKEIENKWNDLVTKYYGNGNWE